MTYFLDQPGNSITMFPSTKSEGTGDQQVHLTQVVRIILANEQSFYEF